MNLQAVTGNCETEFEHIVEINKRGDVEVFLLPGMKLVSGEIIPCNNKGFHLPIRIHHLHDTANRFISGSETEVERDWIEGVSYRSQMCDEEDLLDGILNAFRSGKGDHIVLHRAGSDVQMVPVPELKDVLVIVAEEPEPAGYERDFIEVKAEHEDVVFKVMLHRFQAVVHHPASIE